MKESEIKVECKIWFYLMAVYGRERDIIEDKILDTEKAENMFKGINILRKAEYVKKKENAIVINNYCNGDFTIEAKLTIASVDEISEEEMEVYSCLCDYAFIEDEDGPYEMRLILCYDDVYRMEEKRKKGLQRFMNLLPRANYS